MKYTVKFANNYQTIHITLHLLKVGFYCRYALVASRQHLNLRSICEHSFVTVLNYMPLTVKNVWIES